MHANVCFEATVCCKAILKFRSPATQSACQKPAVIFGITIAVPQLSICKVDTIHAQISLKAQFMIIVDTQTPH